MMAINKKSNFEISVQNLNESIFPLS